MKIESLPVLILQAREEKCLLPSQFFVIMARRRESLASAGR